MAERPILFSAPMIVALLAGEKTQTRRIAKPNKAGAILLADCPYGSVGSTLWVREAWTAWFQRKGIITDWHDTPKRDRAHGLHTQLAYRATEPKAAKRWATPLFMPRWASRMSLKITGVRVERVQDISEADAKAEGAKPASMGYPEATYRRGFQAIWHEINGAPSWNANPWVWVVEFEREVPNG